jgi:hypothetical protein
MPATERYDVRPESLAECHATTSDCSCVGVDERSGGKSVVSLLLCVVVVDGGGRVR